MSVDASFEELFDRATDPDFAKKETRVGSFEVLEHHADASPVPVTLLRIEQDATVFTSFNDCLVCGMKDITENRTSFILDSNCDGIAFFTHNVHEGLIFAELKSRFSTQNVTKAFGQMIHSFLKMHAMLSLCKDYSIDTMSLQFIAACQCLEDENQRDGVYNFLDKAENSEDATFEGSFIRKLIEKHNIEVRLGDVTAIWGIPLNSSLTDKKLTLSLQMTQKYGDQSAVYSF